jgi:RNA polymerase sigma-70 factor, ECF subfamily
LFDFSSLSQFASDSSPRIVAAQQAQQSVEARQRDIYDSHRHRAFGLAYYMTGSEVEAEQILTATFIKAFQAAPEPDGRNVDSALLEELRQRSDLALDFVEPERKTSPDYADPASDLSNCNVKRTDLEEAIWCLPSSERLLFLLRDVEGYTPAAIADLLEVPEIQVQRGLFNARLRLRGILAETQAEDQKKAA